MNKDSRYLLDEKFPTLDAPVTMESLLPLRPNFNLRSEQETSPEEEYWAYVKELNIKH